MKVPNAYYITTDLFGRGGKIILGPFRTSEDATLMREQVEQHTGNYTYWIDQAPNVVVTMDGVET